MPVGLRFSYSLQGVLTAAPCLLFHLDDYCFTTLCRCLPRINTSQPQAYRRPLPLEPPSHPIPPVEVDAEHWLEVPESQSKFLSILNTVLYVFLCCSHKSSHPLLPPQCPQVCSLCLRRHCCQRYRLCLIEYLFS